MWEVFPHMGVLTTQLAPMDDMGTHGFHGYPWNAWVPIDSMGTHVFFGYP
jgi:hypothetical protein